MHCHLIVLADNTLVPPEQVSWIRRQDYKLLTVGQENLSSDERFVSDFGKHLGLASLRIKNVRDGDKGLYECQLSSYPPQSLFVQLKISGTYSGWGGNESPLPGLPRWPPLIPIYIGHQPKQPARQPPSESSVHAECPSYRGCCCCSKGSKVKPGSLEGR